MNNKKGKNKAVLALLLAMAQGVAVNALEVADSAATLPSWKQYHEARANTRSAGKKAAAQVPVINAGLNKPSDPVKAAAAAKALTIRGQNLRTVRDESMREGEALAGMRKEEAGRSAADIEEMVNDAIDEAAKDLETVKETGQLAASLEQVFLMNPDNISEADAYEIELYRKHEAELQKIVQAEEAEIAQARKVQQFARGLDQRLAFLERAIQFKIKRTRVQITLNELQRKFLSMSVHTHVVFGDCIKDGLPNMDCWLRHEGDADGGVIEFPDAGGSAVANLRRRMGK